MCALATMKLTEGATDFIDDARLARLLKAPAPDSKRVRDVIAKSLAKQALTLEEAAVLLTASQPDLVEEIFEAAREIKRKVYGNRIVLFAPVYVGNDCINDCQYCGFRRSNPEAIRRTLTDDELRAQVEALEGAGHKRLILVFGEHPNYDAEFIARCVRTVYGVRVGHGEIRRVNINAAPLDHEGYRIVKEAGIGTYQIFHETYHHATYAAVPSCRDAKGRLPAPPGRPEPRHRGRMRRRGDRRVVRPVRLAVRGARTRGPCAPPAGTLRRRAAHDQLPAAAPRFAGSSSMRSSS